jgi:chemotaxis protein MotB
MKTPLKALFATAGIAAVLLTGCVSSKKYKSSQAALQQVRNDSARLAQQVTSLNENVHTLEQKNTTLQSSLDSSSRSYTSQQKSLDYYQNYFSKQQGALSQVSEELKGALSQAGLANEDVQQTNDAIYVSLDENKVFKKNSTTVTSNGKQALNSLAQVIKNRSDVNVIVGNGDSSTGQSSTAVNQPSSSGRENSVDNGASGNMSANPTPRHRRSSHGRTTRTSGQTTPTSGQAASTSGQAASTSAARTAPASSDRGNNSNDGKSNVAVAHKRVQRRHPGSEGSMTFSSNWPGSPKSRSWAIKQGRVNTVANSLLQNGVPKVNVLLQQPASSGNEPSNNIKVIITPAMSDFNPQKNSSAKTETK